MPGEPLNPSSRSQMRGETSRALPMNVVQRIGTCDTHPSASIRGFTLVELIVVIIILGVLAAVAVPRFVNIGTQARVASLQTMGGALMTAAVNVRMACKANPVNCSSDTGGGYVTIAGQVGWMYNGWPEAGDNLGSTEIDIWVNFSGFTPAIHDPYTQFMLDSAPDPTNCWVRYFQANDAVSGPTITCATSPC